MDELGAHHYTAAVDWIKPLANTRVIMSGYWSVPAAINRYSSLLEAMRRAVCDLVCLPFDDG